MHLGSGEPLVRVIRGSVRTAVLVALGLSMLLVGIANAASSGGATVTVQASQLAINVNDPDADLGSPAVCGFGDTTFSGTGDDLQYTNNGSITCASVGISAQEIGGGSTDECDGAGTDWNLVATSPGTDEFILAADTLDTLATSVAVPEDNSIVALPSSSTSATLSQNVDLEIELGTAISSLAITCTINLTLTATS